MSETTRTAVPFWYWIIAVIALLWNLIGLFDFYSSVTMNLEYLQASGESVVEFVKHMPMWAKAAWGIAVIASVLGSICLLLRKAWAFKLFVLALIGQILALIYQFTAEQKIEVEGATLATVIIFVIALFLIWFAHLANKKGWTN